MKLLVVVFALLVRNVLADDDVQMDTAKEDEEQSSQDQEHVTKTPDPTPGEGLKKEMITYGELEELVKSGYDVVIAVVAEPGELSVEYLKKLPDIKKELENSTEHLAMFAMNAQDPKNARLAEQRIRVIPATVFFLRDMNGIIYNDDRTASSLKKFHQRLHSATVRRIENNNDLSAFDRSAYATVLFGVNDANEEASDILLLARRFLDAKFGYIVKGSALAEHFPDYLYLTRMGEERIILKEKKSKKETEDFIRAQTHQPLFHFPTEAHLLSWLDEDAYLVYADTLDGILQNGTWMQNIGNKQRGKYLSILCNVEAPEIKKAMDFLALKGDNYPYVRLYVRSTDTLYAMEENMLSADGITEQTVTYFLKLFEEEQLRPFVKSQFPPHDWDALSLKTLVGYTYASNVQNKTMNVLVLLHKAENTDAVELFKKIAELYKDIKNIFVAKMNVELNAIPKLFHPIEKVPSVRLYEERTNVERLFESDDLTEEGIKTFIEQTTGITLKSKEASAEEQPIISEIGEDAHEEL